MVKYKSHVILNLWEYSKCITKHVTLQKKFKHNLIKLEVCIQITKNVTKYSQMII